MIRFPIIFSNSYIYYNIGKQCRNGIKSKMNNTNEYIFQINQ